MMSYRIALAEAIDLAQHDELQAAIQKIDSVLDGAFSHGDIAQVSLLIRNIALFCEQAHDYPKACEYYHRFLSAFGSNASMLYALSRAYANNGNRDQSSAYRKLAREEAIKSGDFDILEVLDKLEQAKPPDC